MGAYNKLIELYDSIKEIYYAMLKEELENSKFSKGYRYLVKLLQIKLKEEKKLFIELFESENYEEIKEEINEESSPNLARMKDYIETYEMMNQKIDEDDDEEVRKEKILIMKVAKLTHSCVKNVFLVEASFLEEFIRNNTVCGLSERLLSIKYYNIFTKHDSEEGFVNNNFNIPLENYVDVYLVADMLRMNTTECDGIILDCYLDIINDMIRQMLNFNDDELNDLNKLASILNASFMLQACFALINENDYFNNKDKIFDKIDELKSGQNDNIVDLINSIINNRQECQKRVRKISMRPNFN